MSLLRNTILLGDASDRLQTLPDSSVDCVITSPPYYALRDYGVRGQLGLEPTVNDWVHSLRCVFAEVGRVLKPTGALWLNLGDSYSRHPALGAPPKGQLLAPERLLLALASDGWIVRNKVVWAKPNAMPTSVSDRLNTSHEFVYFLVRSSRYFFDLDAIREPHRSHGKVGRRSVPDLSKVIGPLAATRNGLSRPRPDGIPGHPVGKNPGDVWTIATRGFRNAHFATFPEEVVRRPLLATCPEAVCTACGQPWLRSRSVRRIGGMAPTPNERYIRQYPKRWLTLYERGPLVPCGCGAPTLPGIVLDPFAGTGTVALVAERHARNWIAIELNPAYIAIAEERLRKARAPNDQSAAMRQAA